MLYGVAVDEEGGGTTFKAVVADSEDQAREYAGAPADADVQPLEDMLMEQYGGCAVLGAE